jgi:alanine dehydrogenase
MTALLLDRTQTQSALDLTVLLPLVRRALVAISKGEVSAPARVAALSPVGLLGAMPAYVPGLGMAAKLASVFSAVGPDGRSAHRGVVLLVDEQSGEPIALMDAEPLTALRTAAAATVAMQALARPEPQRIAIIGAGAQARAQLQMLAAVGVTASIVVVSRQLDRATAAAATHPDAQAVDSVREAVEGADVVFCCTDAVSPVLNHDWLRTGTHLSSVGGSHGAEIDAESVARGSLFVEWEGAVTSRPTAGAHELQDVDPARCTLIGAVLDGSHPGRESVDGLTVFKSTGHAALDVAAAVAVHTRAKELGIGTTVDL